jgi:VCBS repeat-containing protein
VSGSFGSFSIDATGAWTYVANSAFDELAFGESHVDTFVVSTSDGTTQVVTATINGTNDAPLFSGTGAISVFTENGAAVRVAGTGTVQGPVTVSASDIDSSNYAGGTLSASITAGTHAGDALSLALSSTPGSGVELSGTDVEFDGTIVGTLSGSGTSSLSILLNASADDNVVQALTKAIQISSSSNDHCLFRRSRGLVGTRHAPPYFLA